MEMGANAAAAFDVKGRGVDIVAEYNGENKSSLAPYIPWYLF